MTWLFFVAGYVIHIRKDLGDWHETNVPRDVVEYNAEHLSCGANYQIYISAYNSVGRGGPSNIISAKTVGVGKCSQLFTLTRYKPLVAFSGCLL